MASSTLRLARAALVAGLLLAQLGGCAVVAVGATAVGVAADVAVGAVKVTGKVVGATVDAVTPSSDEKK